MSNPMTGIARCCACTASGQMATDPVTACMKSRRRIASPKGTGLRHLHRCDYSRDLRTTEWGSDTQLHSSNPNLRCPLCAKSGHLARLVDHLVGGGKQ